MKKRKKRAIVIGTGAGGATMAKELQGEYQVTILEVGKEFKPFSYPIDLFAKLRRTGLLFDERLIRLLLPNMIIDKTKDMVLVRGFGKGGTTTLATGNAVRCDGALKELGINLDREYEELYRELPVTTDHQKRWTKTTKRMFSLFEEMGLDPVLCVAGPLPGIRQDCQILMPFISQQDGYILSPYMDYLSFFFDKRWRLPMRNIASIMIKLADQENGSTDGKHVDKTMSTVDNSNMDKAVAQCREILTLLGVPEEKQFLGTLNAGHPGGMLPLTAEEAETLHNPKLPENLYVADATILPKAMGNPPILTIMALTKKMAGVILERAK